MLTEFCIWKIRKELNFYNDLAWLISWTKKKISLFLSKLVETKNSNQEAGKFFFFTICKIIFSCFNACLTFKNNCFLLIVFTTESWLYKKWQTWLWPGQDKKSFTWVLRQKQMYTFFTFFLHQVSKICLSHQQT